MSTNTTTLLFTAPGASFTHELVSSPAPTPRNTEVVIKNKAIAINPLDYKRIAYNVMVNKWPTSGGFEVSGIVEAVGAAVSHVEIGDEVVGLAGGSGAESFGFQERTRTAAAGVVRKPRNLTFEEAVSIP